MSDKQKIALRIHDSVQQAIKMDLTSIDEEIDAIKKQIVKDDNKIRLFEGKGENRDQIPPEKKKKKQ